MFERLENIFNAIKGFFGFFESIFMYIKAGFDIVVAVLRYPLDVLHQIQGSFPPIFTVIAMTCLLVWVIRTITGRGDNNL